MPLISASFFSFCAMYVTLPFSSTLISLPPMSRQAVSMAVPSLKRQIFVVPPPISKFATVFPVSSESLAAPEPFPASTDSRSGPAVATTKFPAVSERASVTERALLFRELSPVIITAPVVSISGVRLAFLYSDITMSLTLSPSISFSDSRGVKYISLS